jgi:23S rRNA (cytosine1962-C5)-methyltransferase
MSASLKLKPNATSRVLAGHPWVFANEVRGTAAGRTRRRGGGMPRPHGTFPGFGHLQLASSQIVWRRLSRERVALDGAYLRAALERAVARRDRSWVNSSASSGPSPTTCRALWPISLVTRWSCRYRRSRWKSAAQPWATCWPDSAGAKEIIFRNDANDSAARRTGRPRCTRARVPTWEPRWMQDRRFRLLARSPGGTEDGILPRPASAACRRGAVLPPARRVLDAFCNQGVLRAALRAGRGERSVLGPRQRL